MKVALFIPCYIDAVYPEVGIATLELLEKLGVEVEYPLNQTCCGQPMGNEGESAKKTEENFCKNFAGYDTIVCPAGSCVKHVREHMHSVEQTPEVKKIRQNTYELVEFIHDVLGIKDFSSVSFPHTIAIHNSCSAIRGLHLTSRSEWQEPRFNKTETLLSGVKDINIIHIDRPDECCGFGGTFCATDPTVSAKMGSDKIADYTRHNVEYVVSPDMSCMMHQSGIASREKSELKFVHIAQVLNEGPF
ncbi:(Fe-S)-binding protein [Ornithobacterium rhinotracheale]|uniref:(Fe-S)-binding protein n=1 Tax=Ornithobacterium rhinotracheale TaxID=28251 RepID=UPI001FF40B24|nr:(Fe-S)-binding protein [Ornithobacterium rhinotracheale]MCK0201855.1 (Fe-S)-binding protein [Ornithobacterium rhinotracheale]